MSSETIGLGNAFGIPNEDFDDAVKTTSRLRSTLMAKYGKNIKTDVLIREALAFDMPDSYKYLFIYAVGQLGAYRESGILEEDPAKRFLLGAAFIEKGKIMREERKAEAEKHKNN